MIPMRDGNNMRVEKSAGSTSTVYVFSGSQVVAEYDNGAGVSSPSREYIYSGNQLISTIDSSGTKYHHPDHLSVRVTTDSSGNKIGEQGHYPFGEQWYASSTTTKYFFTSYERDSESENDYAQARYHVNRLGRFGSPDPMAGSIADPQSLNRYAYTRNFPTGLVDRHGTCYWYVRNDKDQTSVSEAASGPDDSEDAEDALESASDNEDACRWEIYDYIGGAGGAAGGASGGGFWGGSDPDNNWIVSQTDSGGGFLGAAQDINQMGQYASAYGYSTLCTFQESEAAGCNMFGMLNYAYSPCSINECNLYSADGQSLGTTGHGVPSKTAEVNEEIFFITQDMKTFVKDVIEALTTNGSLTPPPNAPAKQIMSPTTTQLGGTGQVLASTQTLVPTPNPATRAGSSVPTTARH